MKERAFWFYLFLSLLIERPVENVLASEVNHVKKLESPLFFCLHVCPILKGHRR